MNASPRHDALLVFMPSGKRGRFPLGTPILQAARNLGVDIDSVCGGRGICGRCQIEVGEGEFAKHGVTSKLDHLTPFGNGRAALRRPPRHEAPAGGSCCSTLLQGDVVIDVPPDSQVHQQVVRKRAEMRADRRSIRWCACIMSRWPSPTCTIPPAICSGC